MIKKAHLLPDKEQLILQEDSLNIRCTIKTARPEESWRIPPIQRPSKAFSPGAADPKSCKRRRRTLIASKLQWLHPQCVLRCLWDYQNRRSFAPDLNPLRHSVPPLPPAWMRAAQTKTRNLDIFAVRRGRNERSTQERRDVICLDEWSMLCLTLSACFSLSYAMSGLNCGWVSQAMHGWRMA